MGAKKKWSSSVGRELKDKGASVLLFVLVIALWEIIVVVSGVKEYLLPAPMSVITEMMNMKWQWFSQIRVTLVEILGGFSLAAGVGILLAIIITWSTFLKNAILPFLVFLNSIPKIALAPLFLIWLGYGVLTNIAIASLIAFFPVVISTATGLSEIEPEMLELADSLNTPKWKAFLKIRIPNALPYIFSGLKVSATMAVVGAIIGEFIASEKGLAALIIMAQMTLATPAILGALVWLSIIGLGLFGSIALLQKLVMPWESTE